MSKEILINQLFAGSYLKEGENIGHEVINLFKDDNDHNNLFITPTGHVKGHDLEYIIFVRNVSARKTVEVVGIASDIYRIDDEELKQVRYAGVTLDQIFKNNKYHGDNDLFADHITYRAGLFLLPAERIFITIDDSFINEKYTLHLQSKRQVIIPQGMREYYSDSIDSVAYSQLKKLIDTSELWERENNTERLFPDGSVQNQSPSFLEVIRKEDDENIFSNLLSYYFEYSHRTFQRFAENIDLLGIQDMSISFDLYRETKDRVDIWIESEKDVIVIENKIKSGINGITGEDYSQLNKYYNKAKQYAEKCQKEPHFYIFAPNYARFDLTKYGAEADAYKIISYSRIYDFFIKEAETYIADRAFPDFLRGLKRHTLTYPELQFDTMRSRLLRKIQILQ